MKNIEVVADPNTSDSFIPSPKPLFRALSLHTEDKIQVPDIGQPSTTCRVVSGQIPEDLRPFLEEDFTSDEIFEIAHRCDVYNAASVLNEKPKALWIFGPSACGKTTITNEKASDLFGSPENAVTIDGDLFRSVHKGFQMVVGHGSRNGLVHKDAWDILRKSGLIDKVKEGIVEHAVNHRQHLKIPDSVTNIERIMDMLQELEDAGYELYAICLWAPKSQTEARGRLRSVKAGKAFITESYGYSTQNTLRLGQHWEEQIAKRNVHYKSVVYYDNTTFPSRLVNAIEFEQLTDMTDAEATQHARECEDSRRAHDIAKTAAIEAHTKGVAPRLVMKAEVNFWKEFRAARRRMSCTISAQLANSRSVSSGLDAMVVWNELQRCRLEGFEAGVGFSIVATTLFFFMPRIMRK